MNNAEHKNIGSIKEALSASTMEFLQVIKQILVFIKNALKI